MDVSCLNADSDKSWSSDSAMLPQLGDVSTEDESSAEELETMRTPLVSPSSIVDSASCPGGHQPGSASPALWIGVASAFLQDDDVL